MVTCSALRRPYRDLLRDGHPSVWFAHVTADPAELRARVSARTGHYMPPSLLESQLATLEPLEPDEPGTRLDTSPDSASAVEALLAALPRRRR